MKRSHIPIAFTADDIGSGLLGFCGIEAAPKLHTKNKKTMVVAANAIHKLIALYAGWFVNARYVNPVTKVILRLEIIVFIMITLFSHNAQAKRRGGFMPRPS